MTATAERAAIVPPARTTDRLDVDESAPDVQLDDAIREQLAEIAEVTP